jgi:hypothetical protein
MIKHCSSLILLVLATLLLGLQIGPTRAGAFEVQTSSLCAAGEKVIFSCPLKRPAKIVSLCASTKLTKTEGYLQYRFGIPGNVELEYPKERTPAANAFHYSHYFRAQVDLTEITFSIDGYGYKVFNDFNGEEKPAISDQGVTVQPPGNKKELNYSCGSRAKMNLGDLGDVLVNESQ